MVNPPEGLTLAENSMAEKEIPDQGTTLAGDR